MNIDAAIDLGRRFEGFRSRPYLDPADVPTIGYGTTVYPDGRRVTMDDPPISEAVARAYLLAWLWGRCVPAVLRLCPGLLPWSILNQNWGPFNAIVDFTYNLGAGNLQISTLRRRVNDEDWPEARYELGRWVYGGGRVLPGLVTRRAAEAALLP